MDNLILLKYFLLGVAAFFNPCGIALLPAYVSHYLGKRETEATRGWSGTWRGIELGATVSAGFFTVFGFLGLLISMIGIATANRTIFPASPWTAAGIGLLLILMGMMMLLRHNLSLTGPIERLAGKFQRKNSSNRGLAFYYFYGLSYAIASCGCAMPLFASMILFAFSESLTNGIMVFGAYAWGMTTMMLLLSILTVFARAVLQQYLKSLVPFIQIVSGVVMVGAGSYLLYEQLKLIAP